MTFVSSKNKLEIALSDSCARESSAARRRLWLAAYLMAMVLFPSALVVVLVGIRATPPVAAFTLQYWHGSAARQFTHEVTIDLAALPVDGVLVVRKYFARGRVAALSSRGGRPAG